AFRSASQDVPSASTGLLQTPVPTSQTPARWHSSIGAHVRGLPDSQLSPTQASATVHRLPSSQEEPSGFAVTLHSPVIGSHAEVSSHCPATSHRSGFVGGYTQVPVSGSQAPAPWQASGAAHETPSTCLHPSAGS